MDYSKQSNARKRLEKTVDQERLVAKIWLNILRVIAVVLLAAIFVVAGVLLGAFKGIIDGAPVRDSYDITDFTSYIYNADGSPATAIMTSVMRSEVDISEIPKIMQNAIVAIEDKRFYEHNGIDIEGILRSGATILKGGDIQGGSTITQQVIKNIALTSDTSYIRKAQEWYMALQYEYQLKEEIGAAAAKEHILETYLNYVNFGNGQYGVQSASHFYFNKDSKDLTLSEAAVLAAVVNAPSIYDPLTEQWACRKRQILVLDAMLDQGYITKAQYDAAKKDNVFTRITENNKDPEEDEENPTPNVTYTYFEEAAISEVVNDLQDQLGYSEEAAIHEVYHGGLTITLVQDPRIQQAIDEGVAYLPETDFPTYYQLNYALSIYSEDYESYENFGMYNLLYYDLYDLNEALDAYRVEHLARYGLTPENKERYNESITISSEPECSVILMDYHNGYVLGMSAGRDPKTVDMGLNRATDSLRQPGSCFKVISTFAPAIDGGGKTAGTVYDDVPIDPDWTDGWSPKNWWRSDKYFGFATIRMGVAQSMNLIAARCMLDITPELGYEYVTEHFGITSLVGKSSDSLGDVTATMCLGGLINGVSNLELSNAYATIANEGNYVKATFYSTVYDHDGNLLLDKRDGGANQVRKDHSLTEQNAWIIENVCHSTTQYKWGWETGTEDYLSGGFPIACKTGTSEEDNDYWTCAWSPYYLCTAWVGYDMIRYSGDYDSLSYVPRKPDRRHELWKWSMEAAHEGLEYKDFGEPPEGVIGCYICSKSGKLASGSCGGTTYYEYFVEGTEPTSYCSVHTATEVCSETGLKCNPDGTCIPTVRYGVHRSYSLAELAEKIKDLTYIGFKPGYVEDYVPEPTEVCKGHPERAQDSGKEKDGAEEPEKDDGGGDDGQ